jgi:erythronate-4-phosphate dehydrogenase
MLIVADPNIAAVEEAFSGLGEVRLVPGRDWNRDRVRDAELLLVRSVTRIDAALLEGSRARFVGTATSGLDHIDRDHLERRGIGFAAAPGSNATAVAEYVLSAVLVLAEARGLMLGEATAGVIGCGRIGSRVVGLFSALGIRCLVHDPPLADLTGDPRYRPLQEILAADIVTLHVPLTAAGPYPTRGLIGTEALSRMKPEVILINAARGGIVDEAALKRRLTRHEHTAAVIDCWEGEPYIDPVLAGRCALSTPHIAGYGLDAKLRATHMLYTAACAFFETPTRWSPSADNRQELAVISRDEPEPLRRAVLSAYDVRDDDRALRSCLSLERAARGRAFDALRAEYRDRREFSAHAVSAPPGAQAALARLGFRTRSAPD